MVGYGPSDWHCCRRHGLEVRPACHDSAQDVPELGVGPGADLARVPRLDVGDDLVAELDLSRPRSVGNDQLRAAVRGVRAALDVAELLELVDQPPDDLLVPAGEAGQLRRPDTVLVEVREHGAMARVEVVVARLSEPLEELVLQREEAAGSRARPDPGSIPAAPCVVSW